MKHCRVICCGLLVVLATLVATTPALAQSSQASCADASKRLKTLEDQKKTWEAKQKQAQDRMDADRAAGKPVHQTDLDAVKDAQDHIDGLGPRIDAASKDAGAACKKEKESCAKKKMAWCGRENRCVDQSSFNCNRCGCGVSR